MVRTVHEKRIDQTVGTAEGAGDFLLVRVAIDFRRELTLDDQTIVVTCSPVRYGTSSITTREEVRAADRWLRDPDPSCSRTTQPPRRPALSLPRRARCSTARSNATAPRPLPDPSRHDWHVGVSRCPSSQSEL